LHSIWFRYYMGPTHRHAATIPGMQPRRWPTGKELGGDLALCTHCRRTNTCTCDQRMPERVPETIARRAFWPTGCAVKCVSCRSTKRPSRWRSMPRRTRRQNRGHLGKGRDGSHAGLLHSVWVVGSYGRADIRPADRCTHPLPCKTIRRSASFIELCCVESLDDYTQSSQM
jgi:hypothetical protein